MKYPQFTNSYAAIVLITILGCHSPRLDYANLNTANIPASTISIDEAHHNKFVSLFHCVSDDVHLSSSLVTLRKPIEAERLLNAWRPRLHLSLEEMKSLNLVSIEWDKRTDELRAQWRSLELALKGSNDGFTHWWSDWSSDEFPIKFKERINEILLQCVTRLRSLVGEITFQRLWDMNEFDLIYRSTVPNSTIDRNWK